MNVLDYESFRPKVFLPKPRKRDAAALIALLAVSILSFAISAIFEKEKVTVVFAPIFLGTDAVMAVLLFKWRKHVWLSFAIPAWIWFWWGVYCVVALFLAMHS